MDEREKMNKYIKEDIIVYNKDYKDVLGELPDNYVDLIITDPPYKTTKRGGTGNSGGMCKKKEFLSGQVFKNNNVEIEDFIPELYRVLKEGSHCYIMTNHVNLHKMLEVAKEIGFHFIKSLIWDKGNKIMGQCYMSQYEYVLFFRKGKHKKINNCGTSDILSIPNKKTKDSEGKNLHDTEKPIELAKILIENSSQEGDLVVDPFVGIGFVPIACKELNRKFGGSEIDEEYFMKMIKRLENIS